MVALKTTHRQSIVRPLRGFDWSKVIWVAPDSTGPDECSYCSDVLGDNDRPRVLLSQDGEVARFCDECQLRWWALT